MSNRKPEDPRREAAARAIDMPAGAIADRTQRAQRAHTAAEVQSAGGGIDFTSLHNNSLPGRRGFAWRSAAGIYGCYGGKL